MNEIRSSQHRAAIAGALGRSGLTRAAEEMVAGETPDDRIMQTVEDTARDDDATQHALALMAMTEADFEIVVCPKCASANVQEVGSVTYRCEGELRATAGGTEFEGEGSDYGDDYTPSHYECADCLTEISKQMPTERREYRVVDAAVPASDRMRVLYGPRAITDGTHALQLREELMAEGTRAQIEMRVHGLWK